MQLSNPLMIQPTQRINFNTNRSRFLQNLRRMNTLNRKKFSLKSLINYNLATFTQFQNLNKFFSAFTNHSSTFPHS